MQKRLHEIDSKSSPKQINKFFMSMLIIYSQEFHRYCEQTGLKAAYLVRFKVDSFFCIKFDQAFCGVQKKN